MSAHSVEVCTLGIRSFGIIVATTLVRLKTISRARMLSYEFLYCRVENTARKISKTKKLTEKKKLHQTQIQRGKNCELFIAARTVAKHTSNVS